MSTNRTPGRPAQFDRQRALDDLLALFWRKGYAAATQEEMLSATGLSSSTLYRTFGTKSQILKAVLDRYGATADVMFAPLSDGTRGLADVEDFLDRVRQFLTGPMGASGCLVVGTMQDPINTDPRISAITEAYIHRMRDGLRASLLRAVNGGELPTSTPVSALADALRAGVLGALARARTGDILEATTMVTALSVLLPRLKSA